MFIFLRRTPKNRIEKKSQTNGRAKELTAGRSKKLSKKERREQNSKSTVWITCKIVIAKKESSYRKAVIDSINKQDCVLEIATLESQQHWLLKYHIYII